MTGVYVALRPTGGHRGHPATGQPKECLDDAQAGPTLGIGLVLACHQASSCHVITDSYNCWNEIHRLSAQMRIQEPLYLILYYLRG